MRAHAPSLRSVTARTRFRCDTAQLSEVLRSLQRRSRQTLHAWRRRRPRSSTTGTGLPARTRVRRQQRRAPPSADRWRAQAVVRAEAITTSRARRAPAAGRRAGFWEPTRCQTQQAALLADRCGRGGFWEPPDTQGCHAVSGRPVPITATVGSGAVAAMRSRAHGDSPVASGGSGTCTQARARQAGDHPRAAGTT